MRLLESSALNQLRLGSEENGNETAPIDGSDRKQKRLQGLFSKQRLLMQYIVVSNLHQSLTDFILRHNDGHRFYSHSEPPKTLIRSSKLQLAIYHTLSFSLLFANIYSNIHFS